MTTWKSIKANSNLIRATTEKAILIKLPKTDWMFWHPAKCVRVAGKGGYLMTISYTEDFQFKIFRQGSNRNVLASETLTSAQLEERFNTDEDSDAPRQN